MRHSVIAARGAALILALGASSAADASVVDFAVTAFGNSITYSGASLDQSISLDLDQAPLVVTGVNPGDSSGLAMFDEVQLATVPPPTGSVILYGDTTPVPPGGRSLGADVILSWTVGAGSSKDTFTETLTTVLSINRATADEIGLQLSGMLSDTGGVFSDSPVLLALTANQAGGPGETTSASFTNTSAVSAIPEASTWVMMGLGFAALGYVGSRRRKAKLAMLSA
jgi:PEP-CTERM motif